VLDGKMGICVRGENREAISDWKFEIGNLKLGKARTGRSSQKTDADQAGKGARRSQI